MKFKDKKFCKIGIIIVSTFSTSSESCESDLETARRNVQSTVWIGNEDGE